MKDRFVHVRRAGNDDGVAMIFAIMVILLLAIVTITIVSVTSSQVTPTKLTTKRARTISTASAALDIATNALRNAFNGNSNTDPTGNGNPNLLPCSKPAAGTPTLVGPANGTVGIGEKQNVVGGTTDTTLSYDVDILYFWFDPTQWNSGGAAVNEVSNDSWLQSHALRCSDFQGNPATGPAPSYAVLVASGATPSAVAGNATTGNRTLRSVYQFTTTNAHALGGQISFTAAASSSLCYEAMNIQTGKDSGVLDVNTSASTISKIQVMIEQCDASKPGQQWIYYSNMEIRTGGNYWCMSAPAPGGLLSTNVPVKLTACDTRTLAQQQQQQPGVPTSWFQVWSHGDAGEFNVANSTETDVLPDCLTPGANASAQQGSVVMVTTTCSGAAVDMSPSSNVGAGAAGAGADNLNGRTFQLVNFGDFGTCLDLAQQDVDATWLVGFGCKETPDPTKTSWNEVWNPGRGVHVTDASVTACVPTKAHACQLVMTVPSGLSSNRGGQNDSPVHDGGYFCLQAPTSAGHASLGTYVTVAACDPTKVAQFWFHSCGNPVPKPGPGDVAACQETDVPYDFESAPQWQYTIVSAVGVGINGSLSSTLSNNDCLTEAGVGSTDYTKFPGFGQLQYFASSTQWADPNHNGATPPAAHGYEILANCTGTAHQRWNEPLLNTPAGTTGLFEPSGG